MSDIIYRDLELSECEKINEMNPSQYIKRAWREVEGKRQLVDLNYQGTDWPNGYEEHFINLKDTIINGGIAIGAFENDKLIGFVTVNSEIFGEKYKHVLLDQLFINLEHRSKGIGKELFFLSANRAKEWNVDKLYICAGSAERTIAFYFDIGCQEAEEVNKEFYESDPRDYQLEFEL